MIKILGMEILSQRAGEREKDEGKEKEENIKCLCAQLEENEHYLQCNKLQIILSSGSCVFLYC
jgi:hypothetical protein